jgi:hypothetical protein
VCEAYDLLNLKGQSGGSVQLVHGGVEIKLKTILGICTQISVETEGD